MGKEHITGGETVIADELRELFDEIKGELIMVRNDLLLVNHDLSQLRTQIDKIENIVEHLQQQPPQESIGIAPNTLPPDFLPPEMM
jgi:hypothetical protein